MNPIIDGFFKAVELLISMDREVYGIMLLSIRVSGSAVAIATLLGIPIGAFLGLREFRGKRLLLTLTNTLMGLPPVVIGLVTFLLLSSAGPLGPLELLYTPTAMILAQFIICLPIVVGITASAVRSVDRSVVDTAISMGATDSQLVLTILGEARIGILMAVITGFARAISEVGAIWIVGGNIRYYTRALTTAIVLETARGEFSVAMALGIILLALAFVVNLLLSHLQETEARR